MNSEKQYRTKTISKYQFIRLVTGTDLSKRQIPLMIVDSGIPGPVIWMTACIHGDEISGTIIIQELFKILKSEIIKGKVYAFPGFPVMAFGIDPKSIKNK